jgi:DNA polymerase-3 subunit gamma/tau
MELYHKYRPKNFGRVVGQEESVALLKDFLDRGEFPHTTLFVGPSGCGKTTLARICRDKLGCSDANFVEVNAADDRGIDLPRRLARQAPLAALGGGVRIWLIDEVHQLTSAAQDSFLKLLEDTPEHVYFMLATTDPQKLKKTILTRSTEIKLSLLPAKQVEFLVTKVCQAEKKRLTEEV